MEQITLNFGMLSIQLYLPNMKLKCHKTNKGMVWSDMLKPALNFFSLQEYTQQNTLSKF
jgi:hypothetical protein